MKRDNMFDAALRDIAAVRATGRNGSPSRQPIEDVGGIGACSFDTYESTRPTSYEVDYLNSNYCQTVFTSRAVAAGAVATLTADPLPDYMTPVAVVITVTSTANFDIRRSAMLLRVGVNDCNQLCFKNDINTVAGATAWFNTDDMTADCGKANSVNWSTFGNQSHRSLVLTMLFGNAGADIVDMTVRLWGIPHDCCPGFTNKGNPVPYLPQGPQGSPGVESPRKPVFTSGAGAR